MLLLSFYESIVMKNSDCWKWMMPIPGWFHNDKTGLVDTLKK